MPKQKKKAVPKRRFLPIRKGQLLETPDPDYVVQERKWLRATNLKKGDRVLVISRPEHPQFGADWTCWTESGKPSDSALGKEFTVDEVGPFDTHNAPWGIRVYVNGDTRWTPFYCLVKVED